MKTYVHSILYSLIQALSAFMMFIAFTIIGKQATLQLGYFLGVVISSIVAYGVFDQRNQERQISSFVLYILIQICVTVVTICLIGNAPIQAIKGVITGVVISGTTAYLVLTSSNTPQLEKVLIE